MRYDQFAFVPAAGGVLTVDGRLPSVADDYRVAALQALLPPTHLLRTAASVRAGTGHELRLRVFEPVVAPGAPPDCVHVPEPLRPAFEQCAAELAGAPVPAARPAWARPGWHAQVEAWAGLDFEQVRIWPLSAVLRADDVWFKAVPPIFQHEPAITEALGAPHVLRSDHERGWMLMEAVPTVEDADHHTALRALAAIHRAWTTRVEEALALGAHDRRTPARLPHTLVHGDFHPGNVVGTTIIDWSDAAVANPLFDVNHYLLMVDEELRGPLIETYAEAWPGVDVRAAVDACEAETYEYIAQSYAQITAAMAADDRWWFADAEALWLARASGARAGKRPSRDT